jgi:hypothetical protein
MARVLAVILLAAGLLVGYACGSSIPTPTTRRHPTGTNYVEIPYPPPPARVEIIPPKPQEGAVWVDGEWSWQGKSWVWEPGGWVLPPDGFFAPWEVLRLDNGKLLFVPGSWHGADGRALPKPPVLLLAQSSLGEVPTRPPATAPPPPAGSSSAAP